MPAPGTCGTVAPVRATVKIEEARPGRQDRVTWAWAAGIPLAKTDFGAPTSGVTGYVLCLYSPTGSASRGLLHVAGGCPGGECWVDVRRGFRYVYVATNQPPDRTLRVRLSAAGLHGATIAADGKGSAVTLPSLPLSLPVRVRLARTDGGGCWEATYGTRISANTATRFRARAD